MAKTDWTLSGMRFKPFFLSALALVAAVFLASCSTNPATGDSQFTALMSPSQENSIGAGEHKKVMQLYGSPDPGDPLQAYVSAVGARLAANTERPDVKYQFFLLDTPMLNAFALPGGYVYVTRGILAQANSEAELASVLAHEIGHITARHSAERYSQGALASLGTLAVASAIGSSSAAQAAEIGSDLYLKSYSRKQESQADELGIRYLARAGYDPAAMTDFLKSLDASDKLDRRMAGQAEEKGVDYFATHPLTADRVAQARQIAAGYNVENGETARDRYLKTIDGMVYGDSARQGFVRKGMFYHPGLGFAFQVPAGFQVENQPEQVVAVSPQTGAAMIFDGAPNAQHLDPQSYLTQAWMKNEALDQVQAVTIGGMPAATASFADQIQGRPVTIRLLAVAWSADTIFRFQIAIPQGTDAAITDALKRTTYSLRAMTPDEKRAVEPARLHIVTAKAGDTAATLSASMPFDSYREDRFRVLNALGAGGNVAAGQAYKTVTQD